MSFAHVDADAFFASVLQRQNPKLKGKALFALGMGGGCIIAASYEAKACGVKTGMRLSEAKKLCPHAIAMSSDFDEVLLASRQIEQILQSTCPDIQRYSVDEWFLALDSVPKKDIANRKLWAQNLKDTIANNVGITVSIGIAPSKLLAKMASEYRKPSGLTILNAAEDISVDAFLQASVAEAIPGVGKRRSLHTQSRGWKTAWDIAQAEKEDVLSVFGRPGLVMQQELLGIAVEQLETDPHPPKSISRCRSFHKTHDASIILSHLLDHLTYTIIKMRRHKLACTGVSVWLRNGEYKHDSAECKLPQPMDTEDQLFPYIERCFKQVLQKQLPATQIGLGLFGLQAKGAAQYSLFEETQRIERAENVQKTLDTLHKEYGRDIVTRAAALATKRTKRKALHTL